MLLFKDRSYAGKLLLLFYFDPAYLSDLSQRLATQYQAAKPFPHVVIDNFISDERVLDDVLAEFPAPDPLDWIQYNQATEKKLASPDETRLGPATRHLLQQFNSLSFCLFFEKLTGIEGIIPDPHFWGGGLHQIEPGGYLKVHSDFNWYGKLKLDRRLNVLLYLNKNWDEQYGGQLELWSRDMSRCEAKVLPVANRCVIFSTTNNSYHGHPEVLTCPEGWTRKSLALYYYSNGRPQDEKPTQACSKPALAKSSQLAQEVLCAVSYRRCFWIFFGSCAHHVYTRRERIAHGGNDAFEKSHRLRGCHCCSRDCARPSLCRLQRRAGHRV